MYKEFRQDIDPYDNIIIALGDSFTQGVGAYPKDIWDTVKNPYFNINGDKYIDHQHKNCWPSVLGRYLNYKVINLGINGVGNRAAVKELYLSNMIQNHKGSVIVVFMMSGMNRLDFIKKEYNSEQHLRWMTLWPLRRSGEYSVIEKEYLDKFYSEKYAAIETLLTLAEAQTYCKAHNYKFIFGVAFDSLINEISLGTILGDDSHLINIVNWTNFIKPKKFSNFMDMLLSMENSKGLNSSNYMEYCSKLKTVSKYLTPCMHWTVEGQQEVAKEITDFIHKNKILESHS